MRRHCLLDAFRRTRQEMMSVHAPLADADYVFRCYFRQLIDFCRR